MQRYLTYNGVSSDTLGIKLISMPRRYAPGMEGDSVTVSGRDGDLFITGGTRSTYELEQKCTARRSRLSDISNFLVPSGLLVFSDEPGLAINARISDETEFIRLTNDSDPLYSFTIKFICQPFFYVVPPAADIVITASGTAVVNPYYAASRPRITLQGTGDITLNIGRYTSFLTGLEDGIIIDSELLDAFTYDGALLANNSYEGDFPLLQPGTSFVSWQGDVTQITFTPRWRTL